MTPQFGVFVFEGYYTLTDDFPLLSKINSPNFWFSQDNDMCAIYVILLRLYSSAHNGLHITDNWKLFNAMVTRVKAVAGDKSRKDEELVYAGEYLDINGTPKSDYTKNLRARRLICRICKFKFRTRQETQDHIRRKHRRRHAKSGNSLHKL
ncbi:MAG: hypothetical protein WBX01_07980 [Nitrososphaeraceae archaeon]